MPTDDENVFLVFAETERSLNLDFDEFQDFTLMPQEHRQQLGRLVEQAATGANLGLKVAEGALTARGLVQLHPATIRALAAGGRTLQHGGWNIGTLAGPSGKFASTVKWLPAGAGVTALSVASTAGAALALVALQWQLNRIERLAEAALATTTEILDEIRAGQRNKVIEISRHLRDVMMNAQHVGAVSEFIWGDIDRPGIPIELQHLTANALRRLHKTRMELGNCKAAKERRECFTKNGNDILQDISVVAHAFVSLYRFEAIRFAYADQCSAGNEKEERSISKAREQTRNRLVEMRDTLAPLIEALWRHLSIVAECPGRRGWNIRGVRHARSTVEEEAVRLRTPMADLYRMISGAELKEPPTPEALDERLASLRWLLDAEEEVKVHGAISRLRKNQLLIATTRRVLVLNQADFEKTGAIESEHPLEDCRIRMSYEVQCRVEVWRPPRLTGRSPDYALDFPRSEG